MAKKKKKSVLDYDPLAWLNDADSSESKEDASNEAEKEIKPSKKVAKKTNKSTAKKVAKTNVVKKKAAKKKAVKKTVDKQQTVTKKTVKKVTKTNELSNTDDDVGYGFFADEDNTPSIVNKQEDEGFGFFADDQDEAKQQSIGDELNNDEGFGFFTDDVGNLNNGAEIETSEDEGFGFFDEPDILNKNNVTAEIADEGFGFFSNDEELTAVNTETLDISKDDAINLGSELTIKTVSDVKNQIEGLLSADEDIVINADEMIKIDTAGLQLLYSLKQSLSKTGHHIKWIGTSTVINDSADIIGMPILAPKSKEACFGFFEENIVSKDAEDGSSGFF